VTDHHLPMDAAGFAAAARLAEAGIGVADETEELDGLACFLHAQISTGAVTLYLPHGSDGETLVQLEDDLTRLVARLREHGPTVDDWQHSSNPDYYYQRRRPERFEVLDDGTSEDSDV
jgi:hypothetical protein